MFALRNFLFCYQVRAHNAGVSPSPWSALVTAPAPPQLSLLPALLAAAGLTILLLLLLAPLFYYR